MKIKLKIISSCLFVSLFTLVFISILSYSIAKKSLTRQVFNHLEYVAAIQKQRLESIIDRNLERLRLVAGRTHRRLSVCG